MIRKHFEEHKDAYWMGSLAVIAGITYVIMKGRFAGIQGVPDSIAVRPFFLFSNHNKLDIVNVVAREGKGHPGYLIRCIETGDIFLSQDKAAVWAGVYPSLISAHINGKFPDIDGLHYERIGT